MHRIVLLALFLFSLQSFGQTLPLDFESTNTPYPFTDFDGGVATKISNPQKNGINTSATVMKLVKGAGAIWAGSKIVLPAPINFATQRIFKVKVLSPVAGKQLMLKFEGTGSFSFQKLSTPIVAANVWEELTFDFSASAVNNSNNQIVFMFDFGTQGDGGPNSTYLFDDISQSAGTGPIYDLPVLPLTFEANAVVYPFTDFGGGVATVVANPFPDAVNSSAKVVRLVKNPGQTYGASLLQMAGPIDFTASKFVKVKIWSPVAGKKLLLKFEGSPIDFDNGAFETEAIIPEANKWLEITFDYSSPTLFPPVNNNDHQIVFFFDFGTQGDGGPNSTYYFDDVAFAAPSSTLKTQTSKLNIYPNPVKKLLHIESEQEIQSLSVVNLLGLEVWKGNPTGKSVKIETAAFLPGFYWVKSKINNKESTSSFIKE